MQLFFDARDEPILASRRSHLIHWLAELGARPLPAAGAGAQGFLFAGARSIDDYATLVQPTPLLRDRPSEREPLLRLDSVLAALKTASVAVPAPKTWAIPLDTEIPSDITYPLFVRTAVSSLKMGGTISRVRNRAELESEAFELRRLLGWDALILARVWCDLAEAGEGMYGPVPQEVRVWIVDGRPVAWSFHHLALVLRPKGFPPSANDLERLTALAEQVGTAFRSRCVVADFAKTVDGDWVFLEAGPGSCAGTEHERVFKAVALRLQGRAGEPFADDVGGTVD